jgi:hypothetical protein
MESLNTPEAIERIAASRNRTSTNLLRTDVAGSTSPGSSFEPPLLHLDP